MQRRTQATARKPAPRPGTVLVIVSVAAFMASLDVFIVNVALPDMGRDLGVSKLADLSWVLNGYAIVYAALLVPLGRLADRYGRKGGFLLGLAVFTAASAACAGSQTLWMLVTFRVIQAAGAALLTPTSLGLLIIATPVAHRARAVRVWAVSGAVAAAAGPALGGFLADVSWEWIFLINIPVGVLALVRGAVLLPAATDGRDTPLPDLFGAAVLAGAIGALALALVQGPDWGWSSAGTILGFAGAGAGLGVFSWRSMRHNSPVVEPALLMVRSFGFSNLVVLVFSVAFAANLLASVLWMQDVWQWSAVKTGLGIAAGPGMVPLFAGVAQRLSRRVSVGALTAGGCLLLALGCLLISQSLDAEPSYVSSLLPGLLIGGSGVGLALPTILSAATSDLPDHRAATGSAVVNMSRQIGSVLGVALLVIVFGTPHTLPAVVDAFEDVWLFITATALLAAFLAPGMTPRRRPFDADGPETSPVASPTITAG